MAARPPRLPGPKIPAGSAHALPHARPHPLAPQASSWPKYPRRRRPALSPNPNVTPWRPSFFLAQISPPEASRALPHARHPMAPELLLGPNIPAGGVPRSPPTRTSPHGARASSWPKYPRRRHPSRPAAPPAEEDTPRPGLTAPRRPSRARSTSTQPSPAGNPRPGSPAHGLPPRPRSTRPRPAPTRPAAAPRTSRPGSCRGRC